MLGVESTVTAGQRWELAVVFTSDDDVVPTYAVTGAGTASGVLEEDERCRWVAYVPTSAPGWYMAVITAGDDVLNLACYAEPVVATDARPTVDDVERYLVETSWTADEIQDALDAEEADQRRRCRTAPTYPKSLFRALVRRTARALAVQAVLLGLQDSEGFVRRIPVWDGEIRRYEGPYRKVVLG